MSSDPVKHDHESTDRQLSKPIRASTVLYWSLLGLSCASLIQTLVFNGLNAVGAGLFTYSPDQVSDKYRTDITPAGWTFSIWGIIFFGLVGLKVFAIVGTVKRYDLIKRLVTPADYLLLTVAYGVMSYWLIAFDREQLDLGAILLSVLIICTVTVVYRFNEAFIHVRGMIERTRWFVVTAFFLNMTACFMTWTLSAWILGASIYLQYIGNADSVVISNVGTFTLMCLSILFTIRLVVGEFSTRRSTSIRYLLMVPITWLWTTAGIMTGNVTLTTTTQAFLITTIVFAALSCTYQAVQIGMDVKRSFDDGVEIYGCSKSTHLV